MSGGSEVGGAGGGGATEEEKEEEEEPGVSEQKQKTHTKMWGKKENEAIHCQWNWEPYLFSTTVMEPGLPIYMSVQNSKLILMANLMHVWQPQSYISSQNVVYLSCEVKKICFTERTASQANMIFDFRNCISQHEVCEKQPNLRTEYCICEKNRWAGERPTKCEPDLSAWYSCMRLANSTCKVQVSGKPTTDGWILNQYTLFHFGIPAHHYGQPQITRRAAWNTSRSSSESPSQVIFAITRASDFFCVGKSFDCNSCLTFW